MVATMTPADVAYIKVFRPPFFGGIGNGANGGIAIYTRRGGDVKSEPGKGLANTTVTGYTELKQFYSPNYTTFTQANEKKDLTDHAILESSGDHYRREKSGAADFL